LLDLLKNIRNIPELPQVAYKILEEVSNENCNYNKLSEYVHNSPALSIKIFQIINSPFYHLPNKVTSLTQAIGLLGLKSIRNLALCLFIVDVVKNIADNNSRCIDKWINLIVTANGAKLISKKDEYFFASLVAFLPEYLAVFYNRDYKKFDYKFYIEALDILRDKWHLPEEIVKIINDFYKIKFGKNVENCKNGYFIYFANIIANSLTLQGVRRESFEKIKKILKIDNKQLQNMISTIEQQSNHIVTLFDLNKKDIKFTDVIPIFEAANEKIFNLIIENEKLLNDSINANKVLNTALNNLLSAVIMFEDSKLILMNDEAQRIVGDTIGKVEDFLDNELVRQIKSQKPPVRIITKLKNSLPVELTYIEIKNEKLTELFIFKDITEEMNLKKQYKNLKESYASLINSAGVGICLINTKGKVLFVNNKFSEILQKDYNEIVGRKLLEILCLSKKCINNIYPVLKKIFNKKVKEATVEIESKNSRGETIYLECTITLYKEGDFVVGFQFIINDITERKRLEEENLRLHEEFLEMEKDKVAIELAGATAHELNQPLTTLMLAADMIKIKKEINPELIDKIETATERLAKIVKKLSKITKYETKSYIGKAKIVNLDISDENNK